MRCSILKTQFSSRSPIKVHPLNKIKNMFIFQHLENQYAYVLLSKCIHFTKFPQTIKSSIGHHILSLRLIVFSKIFMMNRPLQIYLIAIMKVKIGVYEQGCVS